jgi:hypothetical protein
MAHFYITLPSNSSMHYYPNNTVTHYTTRLENAIALSGDWEVGLVEIQYQHTWFNLERDEGIFTYSQVVYPGTDPHAFFQKRLSLKPGYYDSMFDLVQAINESIKDMADEFKLETFPIFEYNSITKRVRATINWGAYILLSPTLHMMLGMTELRDHIQLVDFESEKPIEWMSTNACDINRGFSSMYVYCNVLEHIPVGDTKAPLLRIVHLSGKGGDIVHTLYEKPLYVPLQQKHFDSIEIDIRTDTGKPIPFESGKSIVTLHFRHCKIPYLLQ